MDILKTMDVFYFGNKLLSLAEIKGSRIVFFLGAGCSVSAGIPDASRLATKWARQHKELREGGLSNQEMFDDWVAAKYPDFSVNPAKYYEQTMGALLRSDTERQNEIMKIVSNKLPGFGYFVLASLMTQEKFGDVFGIILTTNFDDLIADALYLYANQNPITIFHESLVAYPISSSAVPLIIKLHGDAHSPKNLKKETSDLGEQFRSKLTEILEGSFLVFCGYGGNDEGILKILKDIHTLKDQVYWVNEKLPEGHGR